MEGKNPREGCAALVLGTTTSAGLACSDQADVAAINRIRPRQAFSQTDRTTPDYGDGAGRPVDPDLLLWIETC
jgi:hypothetical protein